MYWKIALSIAVSISCLVLPNTGAGAELKIGYVNLKQAMSASSAGKKALEVLKAEEGRAVQKLEKRRTRVLKLKEEIEKKGLLLRDEEKVALQRDYRNELRDFERLYKDSQEDIKLRDREVTGRVYFELRQIVADVGEQGDYTVILEAGDNAVLLYGSKSIDLTEKVIKAYNKKGTKISSKR